MRFNIGDRRRYSPQRDSTTALWRLPGRPQGKPKVRACKVVLVQAFDLYNYWRLRLFDTCQMSFHAIYPSSTVGKFSTGGAGRNLGIKKCAYFARPAWAGWCWHSHELLEVTAPCRPSVPDYYPPFDRRSGRQVDGRGGKFELQTRCIDVELRNSENQLTFFHAEQTHRCQGMPRRPCTLLPGDHCTERPRHQCHVTTARACTQHSHSRTSQSGAPP